MRGPFLTSLLWIYGSDITNADSGDEQPEARMEMCGAVPTINWDAFNRYLNSPESLEVRRQFAADNPWYARAFPELSAVTTPAPTWKPDPPAVRYIYTNRSGAAPVVMEWHELSTTAQSVPGSTIPACAMDQTTAHKFELMERHRWTKAGNSQMEFEIRK